jgi:hypothetical protein
VRVSAHFSLEYAFVGNFGRTEFSPHEREPDPRIERGHLTLGCIHAQGVRSLKTLLAEWKVALGMAAAAIAAIAMVAYAFFRPAEPPQETERKRRLQLNQIGRIAEGQVVELVEHPPEEPAAKRMFGPRARPIPDTRPRHLVSYSYAISGVTYHTAQDITGLEGQIRFERLVTGQPASIKYDPANPSDSIIVADDWSGLR